MFYMDKKEIHLEDLFKVKLNSEGINVTVYVYSSMKLCQRVKFYCVKSKNCIFKCKGKRGTATEATEEKRHFPVTRRILMQS